VLERMNLEHNQTLSANNFDVSVRSEEGANVWHMRSIRSRTRNWEFSIGMKKWLNV